MNRTKSDKAKAIKGKFDSVYEICMLLHVASQRLTHHIRRYNLTYEDAEQLKELQELEKFFHNRMIELLDDLTNALEQEENK